MLRCLFATLLSLLCLTGAGADRLRQADLLFVVAGTSDMSQAISASTATADSLSFDHVAIYFIDENGEERVVEASPAEGVHIVAFDRWLADAPRIADRPGVVAKRLTAYFSAEDALKRAMQRIGEAYDWWYLSDNGRTYCSELVYDCYLSPTGEHIFHAQPMNFRAPDGSMPAYWEELFARLGMPVPEGTDGTNPNDLARDPSLTEVCRFF